MNKYQDKLNKIIEALFQKQPKKGPLLRQMGGCWHKEGERLYVPKPRDEVIVEDETAIYLLWGNEIASWNGETLCLNKYNIYHTRLTADRLNRILMKFISNKVGFEYSYTLDNSAMNKWLMTRNKLPYITPRGFYYYWMVLHPFPLTINSSTLDVQFDREIYIKKLLRSRTRTQGYFDSIKQLNIPIPEELKGKVAAKMFQHTLDSYIAA